jgi:hypothetical protein
MRKVVVLAETADDIEQARDVYDAQESGIGDYCAIRWYRPSPAARFITKFTRVNSDFIGCSPIGSGLAFIIVKPKLKLGCSPCWICAAIPIGFAKN